MYDIYFDLNNMHQIVDAPTEELDKLYDELIAVAQSQKSHEEFWLDGETFTFELDDAASIDDDEDEDDDYPVIVRRSNGCICEVCGETYPFAEPNQDDDSFICYSCRKYG